MTTTLDTLSMGLSFEHLEILARLYTQAGNATKGHRFRTDEQNIKDTLCSLRLIEVRKDSPLDPNEGSFYCLTQSGTDYMNSVLKYAQSSVGRYSH